MTLFSKLVTLLTLFFGICIANGQHKYEFGVKSDNDSYATIVLDEYYSNGSELFFRFLNTTDLKFFKRRIFSFSIGQNIYTPSGRKAFTTEFIDRPYAGYLYGKTGMMLISDYLILNFTVEAGTTGPNSGARSLQEFVHSTFGFNRFKGWDTQVSNKFGGGVNSTLINHIHTSPDKISESSWEGSIQLNTIKSFIYAGFNHRISLKPNGIAHFNSTNFNGTTLNQTQQNNELFFGFKTKLQYQINDYTVTGRLLQNESEAVYALTPIIWHNDFGLYVNNQRFIFSYHFNIHTKNVKQINKFFILYGSVKASFRF